MEAQLQWGDELDALTVRTVFDENYPRLWEECYAEEVQAGMAERF